VIFVRPVAGDATYRLAADVPPLEAEPDRIRFAAGATSTTDEGSVAARARDRYLVEARAGQTMRVLLAPDQGNATLEVYAPDGALLSGNAGDAPW
jgi:hypothetical protein